MDYESIKKPAVYYWYCSKCFDSGISNMKPIRCPNCNYSYVSYEIKEINKKEVDKIEYEKYQSKKRTK